MGKVIVVGIGPGSYEDMTIRADTALRACDAIVGYPVYVDLVRDRYPGKELHSTPMTREAERCQLALELVRSGKTVAMSAPVTAVSTAWRRWSMSCGARRRSLKFRWCRV